MCKVLQPRPAVCCYTVTVRAVRKHVAYHKTSVRDIAVRTRPQLSPCIDSSKTMSLCATKAYPWHTMQRSVQLQAPAGVCRGQPLTPTAWSRAGLHVLQKTTLRCPCQESNPQCPTRRAAVDASITKCQVRGLVKYVRQSPT